MGHCDLILIFACCLNSVLVVKSQQGEYDVTEKWNTHMPFELWCWRRLLRIPRTASRSNKPILKKKKKNQSWIFTGRTDAEAEAPIICPHDGKNWLIGKDPDIRKDLRQEEKGKTGWDGWMASPSRWTWTWVSSRSWWWIGKPGMLQSMALQRDGHDWKDWTELNKQNKETDKPNCIKLVTSCPYNTLLKWL